MYLVLIQIVLTLKTDDDAYSEILKPNFMAAPLYYSRSSSFYSSQYSSVQSALGIVGNFVFLTMFLNSKILSFWTTHDVCLQHAFMKEGRARDLHELLQHNYTDSQFTLFYYPAIYRPLAS